MKAYCHDSIYGGVQCSISISYMEAFNVRSIDQIKWNKMEV